MEPALLQKALDTGAALAAPQTVPDHSMFSVVPDGYRLHSLEFLQRFPSRVKQVVRVFDADSFIKYFTDYCGENSRIFVDVQAPSIVGVIDYHEPPSEGLDTQPNWSDHRVAYGFTPTKEWQAWNGKNKHVFSQAEFAEFIEENLPDISVPHPAQMLEISRTLEAKKNVNFSSSTRLSDGQVQFAYEEEIRGTAARGTLEIPSLFSLAISPYQGAPAYKVDARLRYRLKENHLAIWYELVRPHKITEDAVKEVVSQIRAGVVNPITIGAL